MEDVIEANTTPEPNSGCLIWLGTVNNQGYGVIGWDRKDWLVHRVSYRLAYGEFSPSLQVLHRCDNTFCCNPEHLFLGNAEINMRDAAKKFRVIHKLTSEQITDIRNSSDLLRIAAKRHNVSISTISLIRRRETWKDHD